MTAPSPKCDRTKKREKKHILIFIYLPLGQWRSNDFFLAGGVMDS